MLKRILMSILTAAAAGLAGAENLLKNPSFESGLDGWDSPAWVKDRVEPKPDNTVFFRGQASLKTSGEPGKIGYIRQTVKLPAGTKELTFAGRIKTMRLPRPWSAGIFIECCDAKNKVLKRYIRETSWQKPENDWVLCGACVPVPAGTVCVNFILRMHNANTWKGKPDNSGSAWFDDLQLYAGKVPEVLSGNTPDGKKTSAIRSVEPVRPGGVFLPGEKVVMKCVLEKSGLDAGYTITDFFGKKIAEGKVGSKGEIAFDAPKKNGYYVVKVTLDGNRYGEKTGSFIVEEKIASVDPFFLMCYHYMRPEFMPAARALGYGGMTIPMFPFRIEPQPGKYVFTYSDKLLETAEKLGMKAHGHFSLPGYPVWSLPAWQRKQMPQMMKTGYTEEYYRQVRNFVRATVRHYGKRIRSWSQVGEINLQLRHSPYYEDRYLRVLQIIHSEVKTFDPELLVVSLSTSEVGYPNYSYLKHILPKALPYLDVVGPDWYNNPWVFGPGYRPLSEEKAGFREQILDVRKLAKGKMLSIEEKGYGYAAGMPFDHPSLKENAAIAQRGQIIAKGLGLLHWIPHYGISQKESKTFDMGMWLKNNPRPILAATATIARLLANAHDAVEIHPSPVIWGYVFKKDGRAIAAIWQSSSKPIVETNLTLPEDAVCYDIMGNPCPFEGKISNYPIFVESSETQTQLAERIRKSSFRLPQYAAECQFASDSELRLVIRNLAGKELKLYISHPHSEAKTVSIPADSPLKTVRFPLKKTIRPGCKSDFTLVCNGEKRVIPAVLNASPVIRLKDVKLDGTLGSFAGIKPIVMDHSGFLFPYDAAPNGLWTGKKDLSAKIYLGYDEKNLYIGAEVTDDQWFFTQTGSMLWNQDAIEISVDPLNNALSDEIKTRGYDADDLDFSYGQSAKGPAAWCFVHPDKAKLGNRSDLTPVVRKKDDATMILEFAIPWKEMGIKPEKGRIFGFNLGVFDRESATGATSYSMALSAGTTNGKDPSCYRKFILSGD